MNSLKAWAKRLLSYQKRNWTLEDYPIRFHEECAQAMNPVGRLRPYRWTAQVINWWQMTGQGGTKTEAFESLGKSFDCFCQTHPSLPRPGTGAPLEFASAVTVERHADLAKDFMAHPVAQLRRVFHL